MFGMTIIRTSELPFYREITELIKRQPEYLDGIRKGIVHIKFLPGHGPKKARPMTEAELEYAKGMAASPATPNLGVGQSPLADLFPHCSEFQEKAGVEYD